MNTSSSILIFKNATPSVRIGWLLTAIARLTTFSNRIPGSFSLSCSQVSLFTKLMVDTVSIRKLVFNPSTSQSTYSVFEVGMFVVAVEGEFSSYCRCSLKD
jgi:hypothetical protein